MIWWGLIATVLVVIVCLIANAFRVKAKREREEADALRRANDTLKGTIQRMNDEAARQRRVADKIEENHDKAETKKSEIRNNPTPGDRARAATDAMHELAARTNNRRKTDTTPGA